MPKKRMNKKLREDFNLNDNDINSRDFNALIYDTIMTLKVNEPAYLFSKEQLDLVVNYYKKKNKEIAYSCLGDGIYSIRLVRKGKKKL